MRNLADAVFDLSRNLFDWRVSQLSGNSSNNSKQQMGVGLEEAVKDILAGVTKDTWELRENLYNSHLAYQGSANNPPDAMYRGGDAGDAFETKKIESADKGSLALNSSPPYTQLTSNNKRITADCRKAEEWTKRDMFYAIGNIQSKAKVGNWLWIVQGSVFAQDFAHYEAIENSLKPAIDDVLTEQGFLPKVTNELGGVKEVDHLGRTSLRIRPMWNVSNPAKDFSKLEGAKENKDAYLVCHVLMLRSKWEDLLKRSNEEVRDFSESDEGKRITHFVYVEDPNGLGPDLECVLIRTETP